MLPALPGAITFIILLTIFKNYNLWDTFRFSTNSQVTQCNAPPSLIRGLEYIGIILSSGNNLENVSIAAMSLSQSAFLDNTGSKIALGSCK